MTWRVTEVLLPQTELEPHPVTWTLFAYENTVAGCADLTWIVFSSMFISRTAFPSEDSI